MAVATTLTMQAILQAILTPDATNSPAGGGEGQTILNAYDQSLQLNSGTTPAIDVEPVDLSRTFAAASETVDLTTCPAARDIVEIPDYDLTGKKIIAALFVSPITNNAAGITISPGAANPYPLQGTGNDITLLPGELKMLGRLTGLASNRPAVAPTVKEIDFAGTVGDVLTAFLVFGT